MLRRTAVAHPLMSMAMPTILYQQQVRAREDEAARQAAGIVTRAPKERRRWTGLPPGEVNGIVVNVSSGMTIRAARSSRNRRLIPCEHGCKDRARCPKCHPDGSMQICLHGRRKTRCTDCGVGGSLCVHYRNKDKCSQCQGCEHGKHRATCKFCRCPHGSVNTRCKECN